MSDSRCLQLDQIENKLENSQVSPEDELKTFLDIILINHPPAPSKRTGFWLGSAGLAYLFFQISKAFPSLIIRGKSANYWCGEYLANSKPTEDDVSPKHCGQSSAMLSYLAIGAAYTKDIRFVELFVKYLPDVTAHDHQASDEWWNGKAGALAMARMILENFPDSKEILEPFGRDVIKAILKDGPPWDWHGKEYLGAAHGEIGVLTQIILWNPEFAEKMEGYLTEMLSIQVEDGNWPSSLPGGRTKLVQFCHGAGGWVISLLALRPHFPNLHSQIDQAVSKGRNCILEKGLLRKIPNLCHGIAGNALALAPEQREVFLKLCTLENYTRGIEEGWFTEDASYGEKYSLGSGLGGIAWLWATVCTDSRLSGIPGYS
ncbi:hypothetical protein F5884DRAFT_803260 [Xylogone sp. PMI_703]|nr:hypothetical protein F5884DRAFT_803260 [Xylogone sp. PMI_703]